MPKKAMDFTKACVYKICCKDITVKDVYVGSTTNLAQRRSQHKCHCNRPDSKGHNSPVYRFIRDNGGWDCWEVVKIEDFSCECDEDLRRRERHWMETLEATLNSHNPFTGFATGKEYFKDYSKVYRQNHKAEVTAKNKARYQDHKAEFAAKHKAYYQDHKAEVIAKNKAYYQDHKAEVAARVSEKVTCEHCQSIVTKSGLSVHRKTVKCRRARGEIE